MTDLVFWAMALVFTIGLILGLAFLMRRVIGQGPMPQSGLFGKSAARRLKIIESLPVDHKSRLILIARDNKEHLILVNQTSELVIESNISDGVVSGAAPEDKTS